MAQKWTLHMSSSMGPTVYQLFSYRVGGKSENVAVLYSIFIYPGPGYTLCLIALGADL